MNLEELDYEEDEFMNDFDDVAVDEFHPEFDEFDRDLFGGSDSLAEALGEILNDSYAGANMDELHDVLDEIQESLTPAEAFNFRKALRAAAKTGTQILKDPMVGQIAQTALPIAGGALGTMIGGPAGTMVGAQLGQVAGSAFAGAQQAHATPATQPTVGRPVATPMTAAQPQASPLGANGSPAAAQLLQLLQNPAVQKGLLALAMGSQARQTVRAGESEVPVGSFMNLLNTLSAQAAQDAVSLSPNESLSEDDGEALGGIARIEPMYAEPESLYHMLHQDEAVRLEQEAEIYLDALVDDTRY